jgi:hypothetical protein
VRPPLAVFIRLYSGPDDVRTRARRAQLYCEQQVDGEHVVRPCRSLCLSDYPDLYFPVILFGILSVSQTPE